MAGLDERAAKAKRGTWVGALEQAANQARDQGQEVIMADVNHRPVFMVFPDGSVHRVPVQE